MADLVPSVEEIFGDSGETRPPLDDRSLAARIERADRDGTSLPPANKSAELVEQWLSDERAAAGEADPAEILPALAVLSPIEYEARRQRISAACPWRISVIDEMRSSARPQSQGVELCTELPEPAHETLAAVLEATRAFALRFIAFADEHQPVAVALWVALTHIFEKFDFTPYLHITSPLPACGKSRLLEVLRLVVARPWAVIQPSEAVLYRKIHRDRPTLLLDEVDPIFGPRASANAEPLRAILNSGIQRGMPVPRCTGEGKNIELAEFEVYCPKALAGIGDLPDTLASRSVRLEMKRKVRREPVEKFRARDVAGDAETIRISLAAHLSRLHLSEARPQIPDELGDRAADGWEPLLAIADAAGGEWPELARQAALVLSAPRAPDDEALAVRLLADVKHVFADKESIFTRDLLEGLKGIEEAPWGEYGRGAHGLNSHGLARLLRQFNIHSRDIRIGAKNLKGYQRQDFEGPWERYLSPPEPPDGPPVRDTVTNPTTTELEAVPLRDGASDCHGEIRDTDSNCHGDDSGESHTSTNLSRCHGVDADTGEAVGDTKSRAPSPDPGLFTGMTWQEERASRQREIRERERKRWGGAV